MTADDLFSEHFARFPPSNLFEALAAVPGCPAEFRAAVLLATPLGSHIIAQDEQITGETHTPADLAHIIDRED